MINLVKKHLIIIFLLITSAQATYASPNNPPSYWQIFIGIFYKQPQPNYNDDTTPIDATIENYIMQLRYDLNGDTSHTRTPIIPASSMRKIEAKLRKELQSSDMNDRDLLNQKTRSLLVDLVKSETNNEINELEKEGIFVTNQDRSAIINSYENNIIARLNRMPHLNGEALAEFFGANHKHSVRRIILQSYMRH
jgi:hypothetical protein